MNEETYHAPDCLADLSEEVKSEAVAVYEADIMEAVMTDVSPQSKFTIRTDVRTNNYGPNTMYAVEGIMDHHTAGRRDVDIATLTRPGTGVSSNYYVTKTGEIFEFVPPPRRAWHAGTADGGSGYKYDGNSYYIGIEIENLGNGSDPYTRIQVDAVVWLHRLLRRKYPSIKILLRHRDFAPSRKVDTSNNFPYEEVRRRTTAATDPTDDGGLNPKTFDHRKYTFVFDGKLDWPKNRVDWIQDHLPASLVSFTHDPAEVAWIAQKSYDAPYGTVGCIALGLASRGMLGNAVGALDYGMKTSDVWRAFSDVQLAKCLRFMARRKEIAMSVYHDFVEEFDVKVKEPEPTKPDSGAVGIIDGFFKVNGTAFGAYTSIGKEIVEEAERAGLPLHEALAMVQQEAYARNIFGGDHGNVGDRPPYYRQPVTAARVKALVGGGRFPHGMNGVGVTQITWHSFVMQAEKLGGAHLTRNQLRVGFELLAGYRERYGIAEAYGAYNAGEANRNTVWTKYINPCLGFMKDWQNRLKATPVTPPRGKVLAPKPNGGRLAGRANQIAQIVKATWGISSITYEGHGWDGKDGYTEEHALDVYPIGKVGEMATGKDKATGDAIAKWCVDNAKDLGIEVVIWYGRIWTPDGGWRHYDHLPYMRSGKGSRDEETQRHGDHVHIQANRSGLVVSYTP